MDAEPKRKRRWFQFSLRTLLILVALLASACAVVRWRYDFVWQRRAMIRQIAIEHRGVAGISVDPVTFEPIEQLSWIRRLLGDQPIIDISLPADTPAAERAAIRAVFPEARLWSFKNSFMDKTLVPFPDEPIK
jgi:hypothetical protein